MKKSMAVASASAMGLGMVALGGAGAATAAPVTELCTDATEHEYSTVELGDNWFMDCIPQYGMGKAEFSISSAEPLPPAFLPLDDPGVASVFSGNGPAAAAYFGDPSAPFGFVELNNAGDPLQYTGKPIFPISAVGAIDPLTLPTSCQGDTYSYGNAYSVTYAPVAVTFTQVIDGVEWSVDVTYAPQAMVLGLNFTDPFDGTLDFDQAQCISNVSGTNTLFVFGDNDFEQAMLATWALLTSDATLPPQPVLLDTTDLGDFPLQQNALPGPGLADTGADISPLVLGAGGVALLGGAALLILSRVRRRGRDSA